MSGFYGIFTEGFVEIAYPKQDICFLSDCTASLVGFLLPYILVKSEKF